MEIPGKRSLFFIAVFCQGLYWIIKRLGDFGFVSDKTKFRNEGDDIYAMKPQPNRFLSFFFEGNKIIITNAFVSYS